MGKSRLGEQERATNVDVHHQVELLGRELLGRIGRDRARVVHDDVDPAEPLDRRIDGALYVLFLADVADDGKRLASLPDVPSMVESGLPTMTIYAWFGLVGPPGMPAPVVARINKELANIRQKFKGGSLTGYDKKKYVCKLLYIYILGWNVDFGHLEAVNLISANKYSEKQIVSLLSSIGAGAHMELTVWGRATWR